MPEIRHSYVALSWWIPPVIHIATSADTAIYTHDINALCRDDEMLNIFTDESIIESHVKTAAVALRVKEGRVYYISIERVTTVFKAELQDIVITTIIIMTIKKTQIQNI